MSARGELYADALYELCRDENISDKVLREMKAADAIFKDNPEYIRLLSVPTVSKEERCGILDESFGGRVEPYLLNFMKLLVERGLIREYSVCVKTFRKRFNEDNGILDVTAVTAVPLTPELEKKLRDRISEVTGKKIELTQRVDHALIGGVRLEMDGKRCDGTVRSRLDAIQRTLSAQTL